MTAARFLGVVVLVVAGVMAQEEARAQDGEVSASFSVFLSPGVRGEGAQGTLPVVRDLHYALGERNIPLYLKESRQSIEYPYRGPRKLTFFRLGEKDGEVVRIPACATSIAPGAKKGVLVLLPQDDGQSFKVRPFWFQGARLRKGSGKIYNMCGKTLGLVVDGKRRVELRNGASMEIEGRFADGSDFGSVKLEAFLSRERDGKETIVKVMNRSVSIPKGDTSLFLLLPKQGDYLSVVSLLAGGVEDPDREAELKRQLPPPVEEGVPVP